MGKAKRDPCLDPRKGDLVVLRDGRKFRRVLDRRGNDIEYRAGAGHGNPATYSEQKNSHVCWITSWQDWCRKHDIIETFNA